jgi:hypothetical protein
VRRPAKNPSGLAIPDEISTELKLRRELLRKEPGLILVKEPIRTDLALAQQGSLVRPHHPECAKVLSVLNDDAKTIDVLHGAGAMPLVISKKILVISILRSFTNRKRRQPAVFVRAFHGMQTVVFRALRDAGIFARRCGKRDG